MKTYGDYIYKEKVAKMEAITREDLRQTINGMAATTPGMDQWSMADLRMVSEQALERMAQMLNAIEGGAKWPEQLTQPVFRRAYHHQSDARRPRR